MSTLLLRLAGPLQSWGVESRFVRRGTALQPTKSGVIGLLAAARGLRRTEPLSELLGLRFGVRTEQAGELVRDFQTARSLDGSKVMPLSYRYFLADAVFLAGVEGDDDLVVGLDEAVRSPAFPLFLGRRSCPPSGPLSLGLRDGAVDDVLRDEPWRAAPWWQRRTRHGSVDLDLMFDAMDRESVDEMVNDMPVSFDPERRQYALRAVARSFTTVENPHTPRDAQWREDRYPDPMSSLGGG